MLNRHNLKFVFWIHRVMIITVLDKCRYLINSENISLAVAKIFTLQNEGELHIFDVGYMAISCK